MTVTAGKALAKAGAAKKDKASSLPKSVEGTGEDFKKLFPKVGNFVECAVAPRVSILIRIIRRYKSDADGAFCDMELVGVSKGTINGFLVELDPGKRTVVVHFSIDGAIGFWTTRAIIEVSKWRVLSQEDCKALSWAKLRVARGRSPSVVSETDAEGIHPKRPRPGALRKGPREPDQKRVGFAADGPASEADEEAQVDLARELSDLTKTMESPGDKSEAEETLEKRLDVLREHLAASKSKRVIKPKRRDRDSLVDGILSMARRSGAGTSSKAGDASDDERGGIYKGVAKAVETALKRRKKDGDSSSDESGEYVGSLEGRNRHLDIRQVWKKSPGGLSRQALCRMAELVGDLQVPDPSSEEKLRPVVTAFLHTVLCTNFPREKMGLRSYRELLSLALALDLLLKGDIASSMDVLLQRFKALERSLTDGNWDMAKWYELTPTAEGLLASAGEKRAAVRMERAAQEVSRKR